MLIFFELVVFCYFFYVVGYTTFFAIAGLFYRPPVLPKSQKHSRFVVLLPSYKEDSIILETSAQALSQSYPQTHYRVAVIADSLKPETIAQLKTLPIEVVEVSFEKSTKVKSLNKAFEVLSGFDYAVILDADNVMAFDFLEKMNDLLAARGYRAVQGERKPKNQNTSLAYLDAVSESINNHIYRQGTTVAGLSAAISGSGVVFDFPLIKSKMATMDSVGGFDRELEVLLLKEGIRVHYYKEAFVFDEKVSESRAFGNQRRRWISSQYFYLRKYFRDGALALFKGDLALFNSALLRNIQLPRLLNLGGITLLTASLFFLRNYLYIPYSWWLTMFIVYCVATLLSIPSELYSRKLIESLLHLPVVFVRMVGILFRLKGANKTFIHTPHGVNVEKKNTAA